VLVLQVQLLLAGDGIPYLEEIRIDMSGHFSKTCLENECCGTSEIEEFEIHPI
jgi:hypothetical protein